MDNYFSTQPWTKYSYYNAATTLNGLNCNNIGLEIGGNDFEYPLWVLIQKVPSTPRIEHVNVTNKSKNIPLDNFNPCAVIKSDKNKKLSVNWINVIRADLITEAVPPGFKVEGMGGLEGPYPKWNLPRIRWAKNPDVQIEFMGDADNNNPVKLSMSFRPLARDFSKMTVLLNNVPVKHYEVDNKTWHDDTLTLVPRKGANVLEVRFYPLLEEKSPNESLYMLFRKLALESST
jgi:hypothetical protein